MISTKRRIQSGMILLAGASFFLGGVTAHAATLYKTTLDTTGLPALAAGDHYTAYFGLTGSAGSTVTLTQLSAGNGGVLGAQSFTGGAFLHSNGSVALKDTGFVNEFTQDFTPGSEFDFTVDLSRTKIGSPDPDSFTFAILDSAGAPLPSNDPYTGFVITTIDLTKTDYNNDDFARYSLTASPAAFPDVNETTPPPVPELSPNLALAVLGGCLALTMRLRRRSLRAAAR
ncbi:hypothetical protein CCAX7_17590 [Capsulimonas corticalis]|uniref:Uncharacterized protein n=1 Tax=Capsulimonas corticalis TaxID=2219043 RepID=A0A402D3T6_9BACT|nr:hypothetical protein [Capsulimonas corticalis]BDI29708.1 hypothetical protein CCAX7_17590 [Capsulimonas corticalis]